MNRAVSAEIEDALRRELGLAPRAPASGEPVLCVLERDLARARAWAEVHARSLRRDGRPARVLTAAELRGDEDPARVQHLRVGALWPLESFADGRGLPLAPGDFGGTTVLVVPAAAAAAEREAWLGFERAKALAKRSPFAGLRVAFESASPVGTEDSEPSLARVLAELRAAGTRSVLVVPAVFCASPQEMRALADSLGEAAFDEAFDLAWLPGLGGELCCATSDD